MSADPAPERWRSWPRVGNRIDVPADATLEERFTVMWALTCEEYGIDPDDPPPMRKDIVRIGRLRDQ
jgi:hypothetical protein